MIPSPGDSFFSVMSPLCGRPLDLHCLCQNSACCFKFSTSCDHPGMTLPPFGGLDSDTGAVVDINCDASVHVLSVLYNGLQFSLLSILQIAAHKNALSSPLDAGSDASVSANHSS